jgi:hypothetical protein
MRPSEQLQEAASRKTWREKYHVGQRVQVRMWRRSKGGKLTPYWRGARVTRVPERVGGVVHGRLYVMVDGGSEMEPTVGKNIRPEE